MMPSYEDNMNASQLEFQAEKAGEKHLESILEAIEKDPLSVSLLKIAWTAGPLTFIALQGGYYLGYGHLASLKLFTYFAGYTFLAGTIALFVNLFYGAYQNNQQAKAKADYVSSVDLVFQLYKTFIDYRLSTLSFRQRQIESSSILLSNTHALPASVALGVNELTNNEALKELAKTIELFRREGLHSRVKDIVEHSQAIQSDSTQVLLNTPNDASYFLKKRLDGNAPTLEEGLDRTDGFLQRINQAYEKQDASKMRLKDAEEYLILLYELLNGRKISILTFSFKGNRDLRKAAKNLEKTRAIYCSSKATLYAMIDELYAFLIEHGCIEDVKDYDERTKCEQIYAAINDAVTDLIAKSGDTKKQAYRGHVKLVSALIGKYGKIYRKFKETLYWQRKMLTVIEQWQSISRSKSERLTQLRVGRGKKGLRIYQKAIFLSDPAKLQCSKMLAGLLRSFWEKQVLNRQLSPDSIKKLTISMVKITNQFFDINNPIIQNGIESSKATNFGSLDKDSSVESRILWTSSMVRETSDNTQYAAEKLAKVLLHEYDEQLDEQAMTFFINTFEARKQTLEKLIEDKNSYDLTLHYNLPVELIPAPVKWHKVITKARNGQLHYARTQ